jgi:hypothetical protein
MTISGSSPRPVAGAAPSRPPRPPRPPRPSRPSRSGSTPRRNVPRRRDAETPRRRDGKMLIGTTVERPAPRPPKDLARYGSAMVPKWDSGLTSHTFISAVPRDVLGRASWDARSVRISIVADSTEGSCGGRRPCSGVNKALADSIGVARPPVAGWRRSRSVVARWRRSLRRSGLRLGLVRAPRRLSWSREPQARPDVGRESPVGVCEQTR